MPGKEWSLLCPLPISSFWHLKAGLHSVLQSSIILQGFGGFFFFPSNAQGRKCSTKQEKERELKGCFSPRLKTRSWGVYKSIITLQQQHFAVITGMTIISPLILTRFQPLFVSLPVEREQDSTPWGVPQLMCHHVSGCEQGLAHSEQGQGCPRKFYMTLEAQKMCFMLSKYHPLDLRLSSAPSVI